ncbi:MAG: hypothetical protein AAGA54_06860 [Myxococcota bacterium]
MKRNKSSEAPNDRLRLFGHSVASESDSPIELAEVTLAADPDLLDAIAAMIMAAAAELRSAPTQFNHRHLTLSTDATLSCDFIVANPRLLGTER